MLAQNSTAYSRRCNLARPTEQEVQDHSAEYYANERYQGYGLKYHTHVINGLMADIAQDARILDVGCGTGIISRVYPSRNITGIDISREMLKYYPANKTCFVAPVEDLPFNNDYFDAIICRSTLHHLQDAVVGLREMKRVLKPGGRIHFWETNASWLAEKVRHHTQHGDRFSEYHHSFSDLPFLVSSHFKVTEVKYEGFLAYPLFGFPDIVNFSRYIPFANFVFRVALTIDEWISRIPLVNRLAFAVRVKAVKQ